MPLKCSTLYLRLNRERIAHLKFILEGYDGLALLSTIDAQQGLVKIRCCRRCYDDLIHILGGLKLT